MAGSRRGGLLRIMSGCIWTEYLCMMHVMLQVISVALTRSVAGGDAGGIFSYAHSCPPDVLPHVTHIVYSHRIDFAFLRHLPACQHAGTQV